MKSNALKDDLILLKDRLETIENSLSGQVKEIEGRENTWNRMESKAQFIFNSQKEIVRFNVGGKKFATSVNTLLKHPETLLCKLLESNKVDLKEEIFFDRSPKVFSYILNYLRGIQLDYNKFSKEELNLLKEDSMYYQILPIFSELEATQKEIEFVSVETSGSYTYNGKTAGLGKVEDLKDTSCLKGICVNSPGWIIIELNAEWTFESIKIAGWKGDSTLWSSNNGEGATISTSEDNVNWTQVGVIPTKFGLSITETKLTKSKGRYIKFNHSSYLGIGYLNIIKS